MKKFIVFVLILIVTVSLGVTTYYFLRDNEELVVNTQSFVYLNKGDTFEIDAELKNAKIGNDIVLTSLNTNVLEWNPALNMFDAVEGGAAIVEISTKNGKINPVYIEISVGNGSQTAPFYIDSEEDLLKIGSDSLFSSTSSYILMQDISLTNTISPLLNSGEFNGNFNGNGYSIKDLKIETAEGVLNAGLFSKIGATGIVTDVTMSNVNINGQFQTAGSIAGINLGTVTRCEIASGIVSSTLEDSSVGGVVGINRYSNANYGRVDRCSSNIGVVGTKNVGGLVGVNDGAIIINSYVTLDDKTTIKTITNESIVGGLIGLLTNKNDKAAIVKNCYAVATVLANEGVDTSTCNIASLIGYNDEIGENVPNYIMGVYTNITSINAMNNEFNKNFTETQKAEEANFRGVYTSFPKDAQGKIIANQLKSYVSKKDSAETLIYWDTTNVWLINTTNNGYPVLNKIGANVPDDITFIYNPSVISSVSDFLQFVADVNAGVARPYYMLNTDIDLNNSTSFTPIGTSQNQFNGIFDGNNKKISNVIVSSTVLNALTGKKYAGLFGKVSSVAEIKNLTLENITIESGATHAGSIAAYSEGTIQNCVVTTNALNKDVDNVKASYIAGGIAGMNIGLIENCKVVNQTIGMHSNAGNVSYVGGIAGINGIENSSHATIQNCSVVTSYVVDYKDATSWDDFTWNYRSIANNKENYLGGIAGVNYYLINKNYLYNSDIYCNIYNKKAAIGGICGSSKCLTLLMEGIPEISYNRVYGGNFSGFSSAGLVSNLYGRAEFNSVEADVIYGAVVAGLSNKLALNSRLYNCFVKAHLSACDPDDAHCAGFANALDYSAGSQLLANSDSWQYGEVEKCFSACSFDTEVSGNRYDCSDDYRQESTVIWTTRDCGMGNNLIWEETGNAGWDNSLRSTQWGDTTKNNLKYFNHEECTLMINAETVKQYFSNFGFDLTKWILEEGVGDYPKLDYLPEIEEL